MNELSKREIANKELSADVLIKVAKRHCKHPPESEIIIRMLSSLANASEEVFQKLLAELDKGEPDALLYCISKIIRNLDSDKKKRSAAVLIKVLMSKDSFTHTTDEMCGTLVVIGKTEGEQVVRLCRPYLEPPVPYKVVYAVRIVSELADEQLTNDFCEIIRRTLNGWYDAPNFREQIQKESCKFFQRVRDKRSFPCLLELLEKASSPNIIKEAEESLASLIDNNPELMDEFMKTKLVLYTLKLSTLLEVKEAKIDTEALFELVPPEDLKISSIQEMLKEIIVVKIGKPAKTKLLKILRSDSREEYSFALDCLKKIGVTMDEMSACFEEDPVSQVYKFFWDGKIEKIWKQKKLGENIKRAQIKNFDYFIQNLFSAFNFATLYVDPAGKEGVDVVAFSPSTPHLLIIGCTTGPLKTDLSNMNATINDMKSKLGELFDKFNVVPIVVTAKNVDIYPADIEYASGKIVILTHKEVEELLIMLKTGRKSKEITEYIENKLHAT